MDGITGRDPAVIGSAIERIFVTDDGEQWGITSVEVTMSGRNILGVRYAQIKLEVVSIKDMDRNTIGGESQ